VYNVIIIGAGQGGLATAFGLRRKGIAGVLVLDDNPAGGEGPWETYARMETLRTPKDVTGPDLGVASLTFRAWYEAQYGQDAWTASGKIPKGMWMDYLRWYRQVLALPVRNDAKVARIVPLAGAEGVGAEGIEVVLESGETLRSKRLVWATGMAGDGAWQVPAMIREALPKPYWAHTAEAIDFAALEGKRVAVLGAGASAFDNAATALEAGASEVHVCFRRQALPRVNPYRWMEFAGFLQHHADLPDAERWAFAKHILDLNQPPPQETFLRTAKHTGFYLHPDNHWQALTVTAQGVKITTGAYDLMVDFVIVGTGFSIDLAARPELQAFADNIARWQDRYTPEAALTDARLGHFPYLGDHFEWTAKAGVDAPYLAHMYDFTFGALPSMGLSGASISGLGFAVPRLVQGITQSFYVEQRQEFLEALLAYDEAELTADVSSSLYQPPVADTII
jgi:cation diffusion facilitator CzcD-associated flavoprotein CzcO